MSKLKVFALNSNRPLAEKIAKHLGVKLGKAQVSHFSDGEIEVNLGESVRGDNVYIIQSTSAPVNDNLMEILIMVDALRRASAKTINVVIPYYGYARQDRKAKPREPITAKLVANMIETAGADRVVTMDLHAAQIQGFFDIPVDHLMCAPLFADYYLNRDFGSNDMVVSPDHGGVSRARKLAEFLNAPIAIIDKRRPRPNVAQIMNVIGDVKGKRCLMVDDIVDTAGTITQGAQALKDEGATEVYACATHGVLSGPALERIEKSPIREMLLSDTIQIDKDKLPDNIKIISVAPLIADAIERIHNNQPLSPLFKTRFDSKEQ